jgi:hypothetical protein
MEKPSKLQENKIVNVHIRLTLDEHRKLKQKAGLFSKGSMSNFIRNVVFEKPFHVIKRDESLAEMLIKLQELYRQYRYIGNNYNQFVKRVNEQKSATISTQTLVSLNQNTKTLIAISQEIYEIAEGLRIKYNL